MTNVPKAYREADVRGASAVRLVVLLYEQIVRDLNQAAQAVEQNDIELRTRCINHAILVVGYLQSPLDFGKGGKVAKDLDQIAGSHAGLDVHPFRLILADANHDAGPPSALMMIAVPKKCKHSAELRSERSPVGCFRRERSVEFG